MHSLLEQEIMSQPEVLARLLEREAGHIQQIVARLPAFDYVLMAARGSSDHAATYAKYAWATMGGYPVALAAPSLQTLYQTPPRMNNALVVGVSQSGQSPDIVTVLEEGRRQGRPTLAITNDGNSPLANAADYVVELHAGQEKSVAATKTYTAQLAVMMLFAAVLSGDSARLTELQQMPQIMATTLQQAPEIARLAERYRYMSSCVVVGRGYNYATSFELALKLKELTYMMATAYSSADFRHGPIATIEEGLPTILIMPGGATMNDMLNLTTELKQRQAELLIISDSQQALTQAKTPLVLPTGIPEWLSPLVAILPGQLLGLSLTLAKGLNPDVPRGLNKVTLTL
ncbi:SIS domain-containing protein [Tengunoibacter tsumagoiensis]|uniref:Glucosamine--fructose-6-phosphate aminotransferase n=1 Tax=Tengunoibacter tsumagoiensis TaxID=2014871 RepID=A0A401ZWG9_9CHLR|nr:SIS domain-containing protein [Tengunoibacter tsumagoiensis]GCE11152.1 glucosamine--fructose-6-phosphate aminotransferase [Tengunoibacter tsumagoiensis]